MMIVDQHRAVNDRARTSSDKHLMILTRAEWEFIQDYRKCSPTDQRLIFRALSGDSAAVKSLAQRTGAGAAGGNLALSK